MKKLLTAGVTVLFPLASLSMAADVKPFDAKLGLWESTANMEMEGMPAMPAAPQIPKETLDKMPPAQRAQVEAMIKSRGNAGTPRTTTSKSCTTKETLARGFGVPQNRGSDCKNDIISSNSSKIVMHIQCTPTGGGPSSSGDMTLERIDAEHVKGNMVSKTDIQGKAITMKMTFDSKWLSSDCGDVKPYTAK